MLGLKNSWEKLSMKLSKGRFSIGYSLFLILVLACLLPLQVIRTHAKADHNPNCHYYITLHSVLGNSVGLSFDAANRRFIKDKIIKFESDLASKGKTQPVSAGIYRAQYREILAQYGVSSIRKIDKAQQLDSFAWSVYPIVDHFYLDPDMFCWNKLYWWISGSSRRILRYNLGGMYNHIDSRYKRILAAYPNDSQLGVYSGFLVNNQTTTLGTQFMTGMPLLTALYVLPYYDYAKVGSYSAPVPWGYFGPTSFTDTNKRKVLNIAGIDVFSVLSTQLDSLGIKSIPDTTRLEDDTNPIFLADAVSYYNHQSYGLAYIANQVHVIDPALVSDDEDKIKKYFSQPEHRVPAIFTEITSRLYDRLNKLRDKHDIILESDHKVNNQARSPNNLATILGFVGERLFIQTDCKDDQCVLVLNVAYNGGWNAFVNGHKTKIERANYAFMAVHVQKGKSYVWFIYSPWLVTVAYFVSILTLMIVLLISSGLVKNIDSRKRK